MDWKEWLELDTQEKSKSRDGSSGVPEAISDFNRSEDFLIGIIEEIENREREREQCIKLGEQTSKSIAKEIEEFSSKFVYMELATKFRKYIEEFDDEFCTYEEISNHYESILFNYISVFKFLDNPNFLSLIIQLDSIGRQYFDTTIVSNFTEKALNQIDKKTKIKNALILFIKGLKESGLTYIHKTLCEILTDRDAVDILLKVLEDTDSKVREEIAKILEDIGDNKAIEPLFKILQEENIFSTKVSIAKALRKLGDERGLKFLVINLIKEETRKGTIDIVTVKKLKELAKDKNIEEDFVDKVLEELRSTGELYSPRDGYVKLL